MADITISQAIQFVVDKAISQDNIREGRGNEQKYGLWFGMNRAPWCGAFVSWCFAMVLGLKATPLRGIQTPKGFMGTQLAARWAKINKRLFQVPQKGDVVIWRNTVSTGHTGLVIRAWLVGNVWNYETMEGNTDPQQSRTGGMVNRHSHYVGDGKHKKLVGFIRPDWAKAVRIYNASN